MIKIKALMLVYENQKIENMFFECWKILLHPKGCLLSITMHFHIKSSIFQHFLSSLEIEGNSHCMAFTLYLCRSVDHVIKTKPLPVSLWKLKSAKYGLWVLKNASTWSRSTKIIHIHDMNLLFKTSFYKIILQLT